MSQRYVRTLAVRGPGTADGGDKAKPLSGLAVPLVLSSDWLLTLTDFHCCGNFVGISD